MTTETTSLSEAMAEYLNSLPKGKYKSKALVDGFNEKHPGGYWGDSSITGALSTARKDAGCWSPGPLRGEWIKNGPIQNGHAPVGSPFVPQQNQPQQSFLPPQDRNQAKPGIVFPAEPPKPKIEWEPETPTTDEEIIAGVQEYLDELKNRAGKAGNLILPLERLHQMLPDGITVTIQVRYQGQP